MATRLEHLADILQGLETRMQSADSDQNYTLMARERRAVLAEIDDLGGGEQAKVKETGLSDFEKRLRERESSTKASRRSSSG